MVDRGAGMSCNGWIGTGAGGTDGFLYFFITVLRFVCCICGYLLLLAVDDAYGPGGVEAGLR